MKIYFRTFAPRCVLFILGVTALGARAAEPPPEILGDTGPSSVAVAKTTGSADQTWDSIKAKYQTPAWFTDGKFGIFMHWGIYSVPAHQSEWYLSKSVTSVP